MNYIFDGSYSGFLCCVFEYFEYKESPANIFSEKQHAVQGELFGASKRITTDPVKAKRVQIGLQKKIGNSSAMDFFRVFLSEDRKAYGAMFRILCQIFSGVQDVLQNYGDDNVLYFTQTLKKVKRESHRMKAFVRFSKSSDGLFFAIIEPDYNVLPLISHFFKNRYADQPWLIYDVKRQYGLLYNKVNITEVKLSKEEKQGLTKDRVITLDEKDQYFQNLWKRYYHSTNIEARRNMKLHIQHVPKRYWKYLVEKSD